jgi:fumarate hydratase subunit beta
MAKRLVLPATPDDARALEVGDEVLVSGRIITAREAAHRWLVKHDEPVVRAWADGALVYHCGPVVARDPHAQTWRFVAAGPATSMREEPWEAEVITRYGLRGVIGKGGMGPATLDALRARGAVYLHAAGSLAVTLARAVKRVLGVHLLDELGVTEAIWHVEVEDFPAVVTMDAHGESLHRRVEEPAPARG